MRKFILIIVLFLGMSQFVFSFGSETSQIVIYRDYNFEGSALSYKIFANDSMIVKLKNNSYFIYNCDPGDYYFRIDNSKESKLKLKVEANKKYYIRFGLKSGFWSTTPELLLVDSVSAIPLISSGKMRELGINAPPLIRPKNRIGLNLNYGFGFESTPIFLLQGGKESKISFGGGLAIGLKYGYELTDYLDLALDANYQFSELQPLLENADASFSRVNISLTPSYIIPIDDGETMRFKLGAGVDYYLNPSFSVDGSKLSGGFKDEFVYKNSFGYHLSVNFEMNLSEKWTTNYGIKYYNVKYDYKSSDVFTPTDNRLIKADGSGIDLLLGINYHF